MTYAQLRALQSQGQYANMDPQAFVALMGQLTGKPEALSSLADPSWASQLEYEIQEGFRNTGLTQAAGAVGQELFGTQGREIFEQIPRSVANIAPLVIGGPVGATLAGGLGALQSWGQTEQLMPAAVGGALAAFMPNIAGAGANTGVRTLRSFTGSSVDDLVARGLATGGRATGEFAEGLAQSYLPRTGAEMAARIAGEQAALLGADVAGEALSIGVDPNRSFNELASPEYWAAQAISNLPFLGFDVVQGRKDLAAGRQEVANAPLAFQDAQWRDIRARAEGQPKEGPRVQDIPESLTGWATPLPPELSLGQQALTGLETGSQLAMPRVQGDNAIAMPGITPDDPLRLMQGSELFARETETWAQKMRLEQQLAQDAAFVVPPSALEQKAGQEKLSDGVRHLEDIEAMPDLTVVDRYEKAKSREFLRTELESEDPVRVIKAVRNVLPEKEAGWLHDMFQNKVKQGVPAAQARAEVLQLAKNWAQTRVQQKQRKSSELGSKAPLDESLSLTGLSAWRTRDLSDWIVQQQELAKTDAKVQAELETVSKMQQKLGARAADATRSDRPEAEVWNWYRNWKEGAAGKGKKAQPLEVYLEKTQSVAAIDAALPTAGRPSPTKKMTFSQEGMDESYKEAMEFKQATEKVDEQPDVAAEKLERVVRQRQSRVREAVWPEDVLADPVASKAIDITMEGLKRGYDSAKLLEAYQKGLTPEELMYVTQNANFMSGMRRATLAASTSRKDLVQSLNGAVDPQTFAQVEGLLQLKDFFDADQRRDGVVDTLRAMLEASGADAATVARDLPVLARLYNFSQAFRGVDIASLKERDGRLMQGIYASTEAGRRLVAMQADQPHRLQWVLAHELTGHGLWDAADKGLLPELHRVKLERFRDSVRKMSPDERRRMLQDAADALPRNLRDDAEVRALLDTELGHADADEVLANLNALAALNLVSGRQSKLRDQVRYLPKWFSDMYDVAAQYMEKIVNALRGFVKGPERKVWDAHVANLRAIMKESRANEEAAAQLQRFDLATRPGGMQTIFETPEKAGQYWQELFDNPDTARLADLVVKNLSGDDLKRAGHLTAKGGVRAGQWLAHTLQPIIQFGSADKKFRLFAHQQQEANERIQGEITRLMSIVGANYDGTITVAGAKGPEKRVNDDPAVSKALNDAVLSVQKPRRVGENDVRMSIEEALEAKDPEVTQILEGLSPEQKNLLLEAAANRRLLHRKVMEKTHELNQEFAAAQAATTSLHTPTGDPVGLSYEPVYKALLAHVPEWRSLPHTGEREVDMPVQLAFQQKVAQALQAVGHTPEQAAQTAINFVGMMDTAAKAFKRQVKFDSYVNESRQGEYKVSFTVDGNTPYAKQYGYQDNDHGYASAATREDAEFLAQIYKDKGLKDVRVVEPTPWRAQQHLKLTSDLEDIIKEETKQLEENLLSRGLDPEKVKDAVANYDLLWKINREKVAHDLGTLTITRRFAPGRESLNVGEQQTHHLQSMLRGAQRRINEAIFTGMTRDVDYHKSAPEAAVLTSWRNNMAPDSKLTRGMGKFGYFYALGLNMPNYAQEWVQGMTGFPTKLIDEGASFTDAYRLVAKAQKDTAKMQLNKKFLKGGELDTSHLPADEAAMIREAMEEGLMGNGMLAEVTEDTLDQQFRAQKAAMGWAPDTPTSRVGEIADKTFNAVTRLHSKFTAGSTSTALLAAYRHLRAKGLGEKEAKAQAKVLFREGMMIGGRYNRPAGLWDSGAWTPVSAMVSALQSFTSNTIASTVNLARRAADGRLPRGERVAATKALTNMVLVQTALAGVMGLPLVGPLMAVAEKTLGFDLQKEMTELAANSDDPLLGGTAAQVAMRGLFRAFPGGPDVGARYGLGNVMGLNENDGFAFENLFGPVGSAIGRSVMGLGMLAKGDPLGAAAEAAPVALRKTLKLWSDDWQFRSKEGNLLLEDPTTSEKIMYALGLAPTRLNAARESYNMIQRARERDHDDAVKFSKEVASTLKDGDVAGAKKMLAEKAQEDDVDYKDLVERVVNALETQAFRAQPTREGTRQTAEVDAAIARGYGQLAPVDETEREQFKAEMSLLLGGEANEKRLREAAVIDEMRKANPFLTVRQARILLEQQKRKQTVTRAQLQAFGVR